MREIEEPGGLLRKAAVTQETDLERDLCQHGHSRRYVVDLPLGSVGQHDPFDPFVQGVVLYLAQVLGPQLGGDPLDLDKGRELFVHSQAEVRELAAYAVLGGQI